MLCDCSYAKIMELDKKVIPQNKNSDLSGWEDFGWFSTLLVITMFMQFLFVKWGEKKPFETFFLCSLSPPWDSCLYGTQGCLLKIMPSNGPSSSKLTFSSAWSLSQRPHLLLRVRTFLPYSFSALAPDPKHPDAVGLTFWLSWTPWFRLAPLKLKVSGSGWGRRTS